MLKIDSETQDILDALESRNGGKACNLEEDSAFVTDCLKAKFVEDIYRRMKLLSLTQADLAKKLGKSRQYVSRILNETANFTLETIVELALVLDCQPTLRLTFPKVKRKAKKSPSTSSMLVHHFDKTPKSTDSSSFSATTYASHSESPEQQICLG